MPQYISFINRSLSFSYNSRLYCPLEDYIIVFLNRPPDGSIVHYRLLNPPEVLREKKFLTSKANLNLKESNVLIYGLCWTVPSAVGYWTDRQRMSIVGGQKQNSIAVLWWCSWDVFIVTVSIFKILLPKSIVVVWWLSEHWNWLLQGLCWSATIQFHIIFVHPIKKIVSLCSFQMTSGATVTFQLACPTATCVGQLAHIRTEAVSARDFRDRQAAFLHFCPPAMAAQICCWKGTYPGN